MKISRLTIIIILLTSSILSMDIKTISGSIWVCELAPSANDSIIFNYDNSFVHYSCEVETHVFGSYLIQNDTVFLNQEYGEWDFGFGEGSQHRDGKHFSSYKLDQNAHLVRLGLSSGIDQYIFNKVNTFQNSVRMESYSFSAEDRIFVNENLSTTFLSMGGSTPETYNRFLAIILEYKSETLLKHFFKQSRFSSHDLSIDFSKFLHGILEKNPLLFVSTLNSLPQNYRYNTINEIISYLHLTGESALPLTQKMRKSNVPDKLGERFVAELVLRIIYSTHIDLLSELFGDAQLYSPFYLPDYKGNAYIIGNVSDNKLSTAWAFSHPKDDKPFFLIKTPEIPTSLTISNGYQKSDASYLTNNRVKGVTIRPVYENGILEHGGYFQSYVELKDSELPQVLPVKSNLKQILELKPQYLFCQIESVYKGSKYDDTCISEISVNQ